MSPYEELRERCARELFLDVHPDQSWTRISDFRKTDYRGHAQAVLAEVSRTLETVTPGMYASASDHMVSAHDAYAAWQSMRLASPLTAPHSCCGKKDHDPAR